MSLALLATVAVILVGTGVTPKSLLLPLRVTARASVVLFSAAFVASAIPALAVWQPALALSFVSSHLLHLVLIVMRAAVAQKPGLLTDPIGGLAYVAVLVIGVHAVVAIRGRSPGRALRAATALAYWGVWLVFLGFYLEPVIEKSERLSVVGGLIVGLLVAAAATRVAAGFRRPGRRTGIRAPVSPP